MMTIAETGLLGVLIGLVLGAFGGGGGVLVVPALVYALGQSAQSATTGSIAIVGVASVVAVAARVRTVDWRLGVAFGLAGVPAAYAGTLLNGAVAEPVLLLSFAGLTLLVAIAMLVNSRGAEESVPAAVDRDPRDRARRAVKILVAGLAVGFLTGFLGVGGGFLIVPALVIALRVPMVTATGTSLLIIVINSIAAMAARLGVAELDWRILVPFTVAAVVGSLLGKRVADRFSGVALTRGFAVLLIAVAAFVAGQVALA